jgi:uncharacterized protein YqjF (DUF2071 family)
MTCRPDGDSIVYASNRTAGGGGSDAEFRGAYGPTGPVYRTRIGDLDHWLTERYCLYTADDRGRPRRVDIRHQPWPLQPAWARIETNTMADAAGLHLPAAPPLLHFARRQEIVVWLPQALLEPDRPIRPLRNLAWPESNAPPGAHRPHQ